MTSFTLDVLGRHASRTVGTAPTDTYAYLGTSDTVISITTGTTVTLSAIDGQGERVATSTTGVSNWVLNDLHGNVAAALTSDGSTIAAAYRYDAYGQTVASYSASGASVAWRYQGRLLESAPGTSDLYDFSARSYSPALGTFTQADTYNGSASNPGLLNHYMYTGGNPVTMSDPTGHDICLFGVCAGDVVHNIANSINPASFIHDLGVQWSQLTDLQNWQTFAWDTRSNIHSSLENAGVINQYGINPSGVVKIATSMATNPHTWLMAATLVPGLAPIALLADAGLYISEGNPGGAALDAAILLSGGLAAGLELGGEGALGTRTAVDAAETGGTRAAEMPLAGEAPRALEELPQGGSAASDIIDSAKAHTDEWTGGGGAAAREVGDLGSEAGAGVMQARAAELQGARGWEGGTTAAIRVRSAAGEERVLVAMEGDARAMPTEWRGMLRDNESFVRGSGHAETTILDSLGKGGKWEGWRPIEGGTSRGICEGLCTPTLTKDWGASIGGPKFPHMKKNTPYRMFWWQR